MSSTKNIGQVVGLFIGTNPPSNTKLIWYDSTPNQNCHKVYDIETKLWRVLNPEIIAVTTYSELAINAGKNGLSIGKRYQIRDKNNLLAIAITPVKIQYCDELGNIVIDDLGSSSGSGNKQYIVTSNNIYIDDINGVLNDSNQLKFSFADSTPDYDKDYVFGKSRSGTKWILSKFSLKKFLSNIVGNSLTWNNGLFFNFIDAVKGILDKSGGIVSWNTYTKQVEYLNTVINNVSKENQNIISNTEKTITSEVTDNKIFNKKLPIDINTTIAAGDIQRYDTLKDIVQKIQRWINQFKYATGISLSRKFADATSYQYVNNNDTVESAFSKIQYILKNPIFGAISDGVIESRNQNDDSTPKLKIDFNEGVITSREQNTNAKFSASEGLIFGENDDNQFIVSKNKFDYYGNNDNSYNDYPYKIINANGSNVRVGIAFFNKANSTSFTSKNIYALINGYSAGRHDAFFSNIRLGGITYDSIIITSNYYISETTSMVICKNPNLNPINVYLPSNPDDGRVVFVIATYSGDGGGLNGGVRVYAQGGNGIYLSESCSSNITLEFMKMYRFTFIRGIYSNSLRGLWQIFK